MASGQNIPVTFCRDRRLRQLKTAIRAVLIMLAGRKEAASISIQSFIGHGRSKVSA